MHVSPDLNRYVNVTLDGLGATPASRTVNGQSLSADIMLTAADIGASAINHEHSAKDITSGILSIERGGTGAVSTEIALENLGSVLKTLTINGKPLDSNLSLSAQDVGTATAEQGQKANSAVQGVKVNGELLTPDEENFVDIEIAEISGATAEQGQKADSAVQDVKVNGEFSLRKNKIYR